MTTNNFFKVKKGINLSSYETLPTMYSGDVSFKDCVPHYADSSNNKTPILGVMPVTVVTGGSSISNAYIRYDCLTSDYIVIVKGSALAAPGFVSSIDIYLPDPNNVPLGKVFIIKNAADNIPRSVYAKTTGSNTPFNSGYTKIESKDVIALDSTRSALGDKTIFISPESECVAFVVGEDKSDSNKRIYEII